MAGADPIPETEDSLVVFYYYGSLRFFARSCTPPGTGAVRPETLIYERPWPRRNLQTSPSLLHGAPAHPQFSPHSLTDLRRSSRRF